MDVVQGYFQIPLDEMSTYLTTFLLPSGHYRYCCTPMGDNGSSNVWCRHSDEALQGLPGVYKIVNDILIAAPTEEVLLEHMHVVLECCHQYGIMISNQKLNIGQTLKFACYIILADGVKPDPESYCQWILPGADLSDGVDVLLGFGKPTLSICPLFGACNHSGRSIIEKSFGVPVAGGPQTHV